VQKELLPCRGEAQHNNLSDKYDFHSAAATRRCTRVAVQLSFTRKQGSILAQSTLARDGGIKSRRASEAKVVFVGTGACEARVKWFFSRFYAASGQGQTNRQDYPYDESILAHELSSSCMC